MRLTNTIDATNQIQDVLVAAVTGEAWVRVVKTSEASLFNPRSAKVEIGTTTYSFEKGADDQWRWSSVSVWGNFEGVHGAGCDASGFRVNDPDSIDTLDHLTSERD
jgi:hypothetical protein